MPFSRVLLRITGFNGLSRFSEESIRPLIFYYLLSLFLLYIVHYIYFLFFLIKLFYLINSYKFFLLEFLLAAVVPVK